MKKILLTVLVLTGFFAFAQDDDCHNRIFATNGGWKNIGVTNRASQADFTVQKKFTDAAYKMFSAYTPRGLQVQWSGSHLSTVYKRPVATYGYTLFAMKYSCRGEQLELHHETNTNIRISLNNDFGRLLFDTASDDYGPGFNVLREGFPQEIQAGVWRFKNIRTPLGFGNEGLTDYWLMTYSGRLPWLYVTRREFLWKRKQVLQRLLSLEEPRFREQIQKWEMQKKYKEQEAKNDPVKLERFMNVEYRPGLEREKQIFEKAKRAFEAALKRVDLQLEDAPLELDKPAVVIKSSRNHLDYDFTDQSERFAEILVKPDPGYFKKGLAPSVPQLIEVAIQYFPKDPVYTAFAHDVEKLVDVSNLQSWIGKTVPPPFYGRKPVQNSVNNIRNAAPASSPLSIK